MNLDQIGLIVGAILTVLVLSYLIGDNFLFRLATHILIGVGAAYITVAVIFDVIIARVVQPITANSDPMAVIIAGFGLIFSVLLLFKLLPRWAWVGNIPVGYLVGVGSAVALGGAIFGTLGPQVVSTALPPGGLLGGPADGGLNFVLNLIVIFGTLAALLSFGFYRARRGGILSGVNTVGRWLVAAALGATFALVYIASVTLLIDRVQAIADAIGLIVR